MAQARIQARVDTDASSVGRELNKASAQASAFAAKMRGIGKGLAGVFTVGAVTGLAKAALNDADRLADLAANTRTTTDEIQAFEAVARTAGASSEKLASSLEKLAITQGNMVAGENEKAIQALQSLGLSAEDAALPVGQLFQRIAQGFAATNNVGALDELFGRGAVQLTNTLREIGNTGSLQDLIDQQREAGQILSAGELANLATANDKLAALTRKGLVFASGVATPGAGNDNALADQKAAIDSQQRALLDQAAQVAAKKQAEQRAELEKIISSAGPQDGIGSELVRIGARGGLAGGESPEAKLAKQQLAELKAIKDNTKGISDIQTGVFSE